MRSPFCSVQTLAARSPLPIGIESFSLCPNSFHVTSLTETKGFSEACAAAVPTRNVSNARQTIGRKRLIDCAITSRMIGTAFPRECGVCAYVIGEFTHSFAYLYG